MEERKQNSHSERGQSLVEFAVSIMMVLMLLAAVADFGRAFYVFLALRDAAQEGAVYATICPNNGAAIESRVRNSSRVPIDLTSGDIAVTCSYLVAGMPACGGGTPPTVGGYLQVDVVYDNFVLATPLMGSILGTQTLTLHATAKDTILRSTCP